MEMLSYVACAAGIGLCFYLTYRTGVREGVRVGSRAMATAFVDGMLVVDDDVVILCQDGEVVDVIDADEEIELDLVGRWKPKA